jgi:flagellar hook capping protein FlgD
MNYDMINDKMVGRNIVLRNIIVIIIIIFCVITFLEAEPTFINSYPYQDLFPPDYTYSWVDGCCNVVPAIGGGFLLNAFLIPGWEGFIEPQSIFWKISEEGELEWRVQDIYNYSTYFRSIVSNEVDRYYAMAGSGGTFGFDGVLYILDENWEIISVHNYEDEDSLNVKINSMQLIDDGLIMAGRPRNANYLLVMKTDFDGNVIWYKSGYDFMINGEHPWDMNTVIQTSDGGFLTCGYRSYNPFLGTLIKFNSVGDTLWTFSQENTRFHSLLEYDQDTYFAFMFTYDSVNEQANGILMQFDSIGNYINEFEILEPVRNTQFSSRMLKLQDSNILILYNAEEGEIHKITPEGEMLWSRNYLTNHNYAYADWIATQDKKGFQCANGDIVYCGTTDRGEWYPGWYPEPEYVLLRVDEDGNLASDINEIPVSECRISNYPNPFNPSTTIEFELGDYAGEAVIEIYNTKGQSVNELKNENVKCKINSVVWDGTDYSGAPVSSGVYYYKLNIGGKTKAVEKMLLIK